MCLILKLVHKNYKLLKLSVAKYGINQMFYKYKYKIRKLKKLYFIDYVEFALYKLIEIGKCRRLHYLFIKMVIDYCKNL